MLEMEEQFMMRKLYEEELSITEISRETGCNRKTVSKYIQESDLKKYKRKKKRNPISTDGSDSDSENFLEGASEEMAPDPSHPDGGSEGGDPV